MSLATSCVLAHLAAVLAQIGHVNEGFMQICVCVCGEMHPDSHFHVSPATTPQPIVDKIEETTQTQFCHYDPL